MFMRSLACCGFVLFVGATPAVAQEPSPRRAPGPMTRADAEGMVDQGFATMDADHDGAVTRAEYEAYRDARRQAMTARRGERDGAPPPDGASGRPMRGPGMMPGGPRWFEQADADSDGRVTLAEARASAMALFDRLDTDHDGTVSPDERHAAMAMRGQPGGDMPPPPR